MSLFIKDKLLFHVSKDYLITNYSKLKPEITQDSKTRFEITCSKKDRKIKVTLITTNGASVELDATDSYYMLRIPRKKFTNKEKCFQYILEVLNIVETSLEKT